MFSAVPRGLAGGTPLSQGSTLMFTHICSPTGFEPAPAFGSKATQQRGVIRNPQGSSKKMWVKTRVGNLRYDFVHGSGLEPASSQARNVGLPYEPVFLRLCGCDRTATQTGPG